MFAHPKISGRLRGLASTILIANDLYWESPELSPNTIGNDIYKGINEDKDQSIRKTWSKLAEVRLKEIDDTYAIKGTQIIWALFFTVEIGEEGKPCQHAWFVQMNHRKDEVQSETMMSDYTELQPSDIH